MKRNQKQPTKADRSLKPSGTEPNGFKKQNLLAAAAAVLICAGMLAGLIPLIRGSSGIRGGNKGRKYAIYSGPILPLTVTEGAETLTVSRETIFDFGDSEERYTDRIRIAERYLIRSNEEEDRVYTFRYPFSAQFSAGLEEIPAVTVNGERVSPQLQAGPPASAPEGTNGKRDLSTGKRTELNSWEGYRILLSGGSYLASATDELPTMPQRVTVYRISDPILKETAENPTLRISYKANTEQTKVLTYGIHSAWNNAKTGQSFRSFPLSLYAHEDTPKYLVVLGDDISDFSLQGYRDQSCEDGKEADISASVTREETTLGKFLLSLLPERAESDPATIRDLLTDAEFLGYTAEFIYTWGALSDTPAEPYKNGLIEDLFTETETADRVFYLTFQVLVPAGKTVAVNTSAVKKGHTDREGAREGRAGYDLATKLGTAITFETHTATLRGARGITILKQNFGFDPELGITTVLLDPKQEYYYMDLLRTDPSEENRFSNIP